MTVPPPTPPPSAAPEAAEPALLPSAFRGDLPVAEFLRYGHQLVDWVGAYFADPEQHPVLARVAPGDVRRQLPASPPARGESLADVLADVERVLVPGLTHWNHPGFFAYFANSSPAAGVLGELLASALNVNAMLWRTAPAATELERVALDWLRQLMGLGEGWFGVVNDTASISTLVALAAAREADPALDVRARGLAGRADLAPLRVYCSEHAHSSVDKAAITLGIGHGHVVKVAADAACRMRPDRLAAAVAEDRARGLRPLAVVATVCERVLVMYGGRVVESGPVREVLTRPQHPYTRGLLDASDLEAVDERRRLRTIPGVVPPAGHFPAGCVFRTRCPNASPTCASRPPWSGDEARGYACFHPVGEPARA